MLSSKNDFLFELRLTKHVANGGYAPRFLGIFLALAFSFRQRVYPPTRE